MVQFSQDGDALLCSFEGALGTAQCSEIEDDLFAKVEETASSVVFDLASVDYVSSAFLRICVGVSKRVDAGSFSIVNSQPPVKKVFMISGLHGFLA